MVCRLVVVAVRGGAELDSELKKKLSTCDVKKFFPCLGDFKKYMWKSGCWFWMTTSMVLGRLPLNSLAVLGSPWYQRYPKFVEGLRDYLRVLLVKSKQVS